jgi:hypothetical protein
MSNNPILYTRNDIIQAMLVVYIIVNPAQRQFASFAMADMAATQGKHSNTNIIYTYALSGVRNGFPSGPKWVCKAVVSFSELSSASVSAL